MRLGISEPMARIRLAHWKAPEKQQSRMSSRWRQGNAWSASCNSAIGIRVFRSVGSASAGTR